MPRRIVLGLGLQNMLHLRAGSDPIILHEGESWKKLNGVEDGFRICENVVRNIFLRLQCPLQFFLMAILRFLPGALIALTKKDSRPAAGALASVIPHGRGWVPEVVLEEHIF